MTLEEEVMQRQQEHEQKLAKQKEETDKMLVVSPMQLLTAATVRCSYMSRILDCDATAGGAKKEGRNQRRA